MHNVSCTFNTQTFYDNMCKVWNRKSTIYAMLAETCANACKSSSFLFVTYLQCVHYTIIYEIEDIKF